MLRVLRRDDSDVVSQEGDHCPDDVRVAATAFVSGSGRSDIF